MRFIEGAVPMGQWRKANIGQQKFSRVATAVPVRVATVDAEIDPDSGKAFFRNAKETTANLSRGGAYVRSWEPLAAGRRVVVTIATSDSQELQLVGRVVWTRREIKPGGRDGIQTPGYGIEFDGSGTSALADLGRYLDGLGPKTHATGKTDATVAVPQP
jgi:hypothetical protein